MAVSKASRATPAAMAMRTAFGARPWIRAYSSAERTSTTFLRTAEARGVLVRSADEYALIHGRAPNAVRIAIAAGVPREAFETSMRTLADLLARPPSDLLV